MKRATLAVLGSIIACAATPALSQELELDPVFTENMVLQRGAVVPIGGNAAAGASVAVRLEGGPSITVRADGNGRWRADLSTGAARSDLTLSIASGEEESVLSNIAVGDVFLCSGQSNMEFVLRQATNGEAEVASSAKEGLRLFNVPRQSSASAQTAFAAPVEWQVSGPHSTADFSAACYFMGARLQERRSVPVGLIAASWGGSIIQDWLSAKALQATGDYDDGLALLALQARDPKAAHARWSALAEAYVEQATSELAEPIPARTDVFWEQWAPGMEIWDGTAVYSTTITLTSDQAQRATAIHLGAVDDIDLTRINGKVLGTSIGWDTPRVYALPGGLLREGANRIELVAVDAGGGGGMWGDAARRIELAGGGSIALDGDWEFRRAASVGQAGPAPAVPWVGGSGLTTLFNGMIAPIGEFPLAGIAWYQGEANVADAAGYRALLSSLMDDWRGRFSTRRFAVVQLADFGPMRAEPGPSLWAELREAQRAVVAADPDAGLAVTIDIGNPGDIHPTNKKDVGLRLTAAMEGEDIAQLPRVRRDEDLTELVFDRPLVVIGDAHPVGFEACSAATCRFVGAQMTAPGTITLRLAPDDVRVRFLWADSPITNLYDGDGLPVTPFELELRE